MKNIWTLAGRISYVLAWPALYLYLRHSQRTRVIVTSGGNILLVKDWLGLGDWKLPGGGIHKGEAAETSAVRELKEETGIAADPASLKPCGQINVKSHGTQLTYHIFSLEVDAASPLKKQKSEIIDIKWQPLTDIANLNISHNTQNILKTIKD